MTATTLPPAPAPTRSGRGGRTLTGTGALVKLWLRRDRIILPVWVYALTAYSVGTAYSFKGLNKTPASRHNFAAGIIHNGALKAMYGPIVDPDSIGGLVAWRNGVTGAAMVAVMSVLLVVRHTRAEEETGRLELIGATVVGRRAPLTAGLLIAVTANVLVALLSSLGMMVLGLPAAGAVAFGLAWAATGLVFAAVAAVTAQLTESGRTANGLALAALGAAYLVRAAGDAGSGASWLTWLSPVGWAEQVRPYGGDRWWVLLISLACAAALAAAAYTLTGRRDLAAGILPVQPGPARAAPSLRTPFALAWRLQRGSLYAWGAGFAVYGLAIGSIADGVNDMVKGSSGTRKLLTDLGGGGHRGVVDAFLATVTGIMGLLAAVYTVQAVLRLRSEETGQRLEPLLATSVGRIRWALGHLVIIALGTAAMLALMGMAAGLTHGLRTGDVGGQLPRIAGAALAQLPAVWLIAAVTVALFGLAPRAARGGWGVLTACLLLGQLGPVLKLPQWAMDLSPFTHVSKLPGGTFSAVPPAWLTALALLLAAAGLAGFRRRDLS
ncbi:MAG: putative exporter of polyketide antibiotics-like protein [Streptosporangiaceae bacterium]|nr:putative exporter of polyketide antibiotics-like protein [Streptosporangiaceae bacterium]